MVPAEGNAPTRVSRQRIYSPSRLFNGLHRDVGCGAGNRTRIVRLMKPNWEPTLPAILECHTGLEPVPTVWKTVVLPLHQ